MSNETCTPRQASSCEEKVLQEASQAGACEPFSICLPFGGRLESVGGCIEYTAGDPPADGTYGKVIVRNGCIIGLEPADSPQYAATPCAPVPVPCDCDGEGGGVSVSTQGGNLLSKDASGALLAKLYAEGGSNVVVTGNGTAQNPLVISASGGSGTGVIVGDSIIKVSSVPATGATKVSHNASGANAPTVNGMKFDAYGHLISYSEPDEADADGIRDIVGGNGIDVVTDDRTGVATISVGKALPSAEGVYQLGGYSVTVDDANRVSDAMRNITLDAGTYTLGGYEVSVNGYGSITSIAPSGSGGSSASGGISPSGTMGTVQWTGSTTPVEVEFTLTEASSVRVMLTPGANIAAHVFHITVDDDNALNRSMNYLGGKVMYSNKKFTAGKHVMNMWPDSMSGGNDTVSYAFDIQAFTPATVTGGETE